MVKTYRILLPQYIFKHEIYKLRLAQIVKIMKNKKKKISHKRLLFKNKSRNIKN